MKPVILQPPSGIEKVMENTRIIMTCDEDDCVIIYTLDDSIPCFSNGK